MNSLEDVRPGVNPLFKPEDRRKGTGEDSNAFHCGESHQTFGECGIL